MSITRQSDHLALERCHARWHGLFFGVLGVVRRRDEKVYLALQEALVTADLMQRRRGGIVNFVSELFRIDPSPEILALTERFRSSRPMVSLRGKTRTSRDPIALLMDYGTLYYWLKDLSRSAAVRRREIVERFRKAKPFLRAGRTLSRNELEELADAHPTSNKELTLDLTAHLSEMEPDTLKRRLREGRRLIPQDICRIWKRDGIEFVKSK